MPTQTTHTHTTNAAMQTRKSKEPEHDVALDSGIEINLQDTHNSHQTNRDITLDPRIEIYLDFQIQLDLNLQTARLGPLAGRAVQDPRLPHGRDAAALLLGLVAHGHELLLQGLVLLLHGLQFVGGLGAALLFFLGLLLLLGHGLGLLLLLLAGLGGLFVHFAVGGLVGVGSGGGLVSEVLKEKGESGGKE